MSDAGNPHNPAGLDIGTAVRSTAGPDLPGDNASGARVATSNEPARSAVKTNEAKTVQAVVPPVNAVAAQPTRAQVGKELMRILGCVAEEKMKELLTQRKIHPSARRPERKAEIAELEFDIGERLRLQDVLRNFLKNPPVPRPVDHQLISNAIGGLYQQMDAEVAADRAAAIANNTPYGAEDAASLPRTFDRKKMIDDELWAKAHKEESAWLVNHFLAMVENGGADNTPAHDEGNNCLIVSLLQHASGDYANRFHRDMAKILREMLVAQYSHELLQEADHDETAYTVALLHDSIPGKSLVPIINALYGRNLEVHYLQLRRGPTNNVVERLCNSVAAHAGSEPEKVLTWQSAFHFEAVVNVQDQPKPQEKTALQKAVCATGVHIESQMSDRSKSVREALKLERVEVSRLIDIERDSKEDQVAFPSDNLPAGVAHEARLQFQRISAAHHAARCDREIKILKETFNERLDHIALQLTVDLKTLEVEKFSEA